jgi:hypothetical protein
MDGLDWVIALSSGVAALALLVRLLGGITLLRPFPDHSALSRIFRVSFLAATVAAIINALYPVKTTLCLVNGDDRLHRVDIDGQSLCLQPWSYSVLRWRRPPPGESKILTDQRETPLSANLASGVWVVNLSANKIQADFIDPSDFSQISVLFDRGQVIRAPVEKGSIYRILSEVSLDRIYTANGDVTRSRAHSCDADGVTSLGAAPVGKT